VVAAVLVIAVVLVLAVVGLRSGGDDREVSDEERAANAKTALSAADYNVVCDNGSVRNAAAFEEPYTIVAFRQSTGGILTLEDTWTDVPLEGAYSAQGKKWSSINVVACLSRKDGTEVKSGTCEFETGGDTVTADRYAVEYDLELHEAKSGKSIEHLGTVNGPATDCPFMASVDKNDPKIYGRPDTAAVEDKLAEFVAG
jgi:hypothetical protein